MLYLIMDCMECGDECDVNRTPLAIVENWEEYYRAHKNELKMFEVYQWDGVEMTLIKEYDATMEKGMALYYWTQAELAYHVDYPPHIIAQWPHRTRNDRVPPSIFKSDSYKKAKKQNDVDNELNNSGYITWDADDKYYVYGEYYDNNYTTGW